VWQKNIQGHVLGAFFYGYLISQIPGGVLAERYGMGTGRVCLPVICQYSADTYCCSSQFHTSRYSPHSLWHRIGALYLSIMHNMHSSAYMHSLDTLIQYKIVNFIGRLLEC